MFGDLYHCSKSKCGSRIKGFWLCNLDTQRAHQVSRLEETLAHDQITKQLAYFHAFLSRRIENKNITIGSCILSVHYRAMGHAGSFGEHERSARVARGDSRGQLQLLECSPNFPRAP